MALWMLLMLLHMLRNTHLGSPQYHQPIHTGISTPSSSSVSATVKLLSLMSQRNNKYIYRCYKKGCLNETNKICLVIIYHRIDSRFLTVDQMNGLLNVKIGSLNFI